MKKVLAIICFLAALALVFSSGTLANLIAVALTETETQTETATESVTVTETETKETETETAPQTETQTETETKTGEETETKTEEEPTTEEPKEPVEYASASISVEVPAPLDGEDAVLPESITLSLTDKEETPGTFTFENGADYTFEAVFTDPEGEPVRYFLDGVKYTLTVTVTLTEKELVLFGEEAEFSAEVNGEEAECEFADGVFTVKYEFEEAEDYNIKPDIEIEITGNANKYYDGKEVTLKAVNKNPIEDAEYVLQWYYKADGATEYRKFSARDTVTFLNHADSGTLYCEITVEWKNLSDSASTEENATAVYIRRRDVTVYIDNQKKKTGELDPVFTYRTSGTMFDDLVGSPTRIAGEKAGDYTITLGTLHFAKDVADNYNIIERTGKLSIRDSFYPYENVSDLIYNGGIIIGKNDTKIRIDSYRPLLDDVYSIALREVTDTAILEKISKFTEGKPFKGFSVGCQSISGDIEMPEDVDFKIYVPLTEEEEKNAAYFTVLFYDIADGKIYAVNSTTIVEKDANYIVFETTSGGTFFVYSTKEEEIDPGPVDPTDPTDPTDPKDPPEPPGPDKFSTWWLWFASAFLALFSAIVALIAVVKIIDQARFNAKAAKAIDAATKAPLAKKPGNGGMRANSKKKEKDRAISFDDLDG